MRELHMQSLHMALSGCASLGEYMAVKVALRNERTGEVKQVKVGWSWDLFLLSSILGGTLWARGLYREAASMAALGIAAAVANNMGSSYFYGLFLMFEVVASIQLGRLGNRLTALKYLENGWVWVDPEDQPTIYAREKWAIA